MRAQGSRDVPGYSRKMIFTSPLSTYSSLSFGSVVAWNAAQCGQSSDSYAMIVIGASALPMNMSPVPSSAALVSAWAGAPIATARANPKVNNMLRRFMDAPLWLGW